MSHTMFDRLTRRAAFTTLGAVGLAALGWPIATEAKNTHKKKRKDKKNQQKEKQGQPAPVVDVQALCRPQTEQCIAFFIPTCNGGSACEALARTCCPSFGNCDPAGFFECAAQQV
jgi:hypothetical protein